MKLKTKTKFLNFFRNFFRHIFLERLLIYLLSKGFFYSICFKLVPQNYQYHNATLRRVTRKGLEYELDISDAVEHYVYFNFRDISQQKLFNLCKPDYYIIDIGTNIGSSLLNLARVAGTNGFIYGFEPDPITYNKCLKNISLNKLRNIMVINEALGEVKMDASLQINTFNRGMSKISAPTSNNIRIKINTLDDFIMESKIKKVDLIKIDVEGYELHALRGAEKTLTRFNPILFIEIDDNYLKEQEATAKDLLEYINKIGYTAIRASDNVPIDQAYSFAGCHFDIIAFCVNK